MPNRQPTRAGTIYRRPSLEVATSIQLNKQLKNKQLEQRHSAERKDPLFNQLTTFTADTSLSYDLQFPPMTLTG